MIKVIIFSPELEGLVRFVRENNPDHGFNDIPPDPKDESHLSLVREKVAGILKEHIMGVTDFVDVYTDSDDAWLDDCVAKVLSVLMADAVWSEVAAPVVDLRLVGLGGNLVITFGDIAV